MATPPFPCHCCDSSPSLLSPQLAPHNATAAMLTHHSTPSLPCSLTTRLHLQRPSRRCNTNAPSLLSPQRQRLLPLVTAATAPSYPCHCSRSPLSLLSLQRQLSVSRSCHRIDHAPSPLSLQWQRPLPLVTAGTAPPPCRETVRTVTSAHSTASITQAAMHKHHTTADSSDV